jgi:hypothetical protein
MAEQRGRSTYSGGPRDPRRHLGATGGGAGWRNGDFDHDGRVGPQDLLLLRENYGVRMPAGAQAASITLVP